MTEDEAKTKWCPHVHYTSPSNSERAYSNRPAGGLDDSLCLGSACMAWRLTVDPTKDWHSEARDGHRERHGRFVPQGYCGLAGRPA